MSLNEEIRQLLNSYSLPADVGRQMGEAMARLDANRVAPGLAVGEKAADFRLPNAAGQNVSLEERLSQGPVVLTFYRGAWCPICNLQLLAFERALPGIRSLGASVIAVAPDDSEPTPNNSRLDFDLLTDADQSVIRAYRLHYRVPDEVRWIYTGVFDTDVSSFNADGSWNLPVPATFIVDRGGIVRNRHVTADYLRRMEPDEVVAALNALKDS